MSFWYGNQQFQPWPTVEDGDSFFHAAFGKNNCNQQACFDSHARLKRMQWSAFLTYFESNTMLTCLEDQLQKCFTANGKFVHSLIANVECFSDYAEDVMQSEHQIYVEELPVLATLLNVRVVLFVDDKGAPDVFEPNPGLVGNYPIENTNPLVEAVAWLRGSTFVRLQAQFAEAREVAELRVAEPSTMEPKDMHLESYEKHPFGIGAIFYHANMLALFLTNGIRKFPNWRLAANKKDAGYFDDIIFELLPSNKTILVQAQFKTANWISYKSLLNRFCLPRCYFSYHKIKHKYKIRNVVLCTNTDLALKGKLAELANRERLPIDSIFHYEGVESWCYTLTEKIIPDLKECLEQSPNRDNDTISEENIREFLDHFQIIARYPSKGNFHTIIERTVFSLGYFHQLDSKDYVQHLNNKIIKWLDDRVGTYLTEVDAKAFLCEYRSKQFCGKLYDLKIHFKADRLAFDSFKRILHIIPQREYTLSLIKVYRFLQGREIKSLFVNSKDSIDIQKQMIEAFGALKSTICLVMCVDGKNEEVIREMCDRITRIVNDYGYKKVILIAGKDDRVIKRMAIENGNLYEKMEDKISFTDLTEESQERLLEEVIGFFEANL